MHFSSLWTKKIVCLYIETTREIYYYNSRISDTNIEDTDFVDL